MVRLATDIIMNYVWRITKLLYSHKKEKYQRHQQAEVRTSEQILNGEGVTIKDRDWPV